MSMGVPESPRVMKVMVGVRRLPLQRQFARVVPEVERICERRVVSGREIEGLCGGLMQRGFRGELAG
jgi:hypothetical protein